MVIHSSKWILGSLLLLMLLFPALFGLVVRATDAGIEDDNIEISEEPADTQQDQAAAGSTPSASASSSSATPTNDLDSLDVGLYSAQDVESACLFPDYPDRKIPIGKTVDVVLGFANRGTAKSAYLVDVVAGYLVSPIDPNFYIQNFTAFGYNVSVKPEEESSVRYRFRTDPRLDPREYGVRIDVFYRNDANRTFVTSFFNETVHLIDTSSGLDPRAFFGYVAITSVFGLIGFLLYKLIQNKMGAKKKSAARKQADQQLQQESQQESSAAAARSSKEIDYDWIPRGHGHLRKKKTGSNQNNNNKTEARQYQSD